MEIKLLLLKSIGVLYYSSHSNKNETEALVNLVERVMEHLNLPDDPMEANRERSALLKLRSVLVWMKGKGCNSGFDLNDLMARIRVAVGDSDRLYDLYLKTLLLVDDPDAASDKVTEISAELHDFIAVEEFSNLLRKASRTVGFDREKIDDIRGYRDELISRLQVLQLGGKKSASGNGRMIDISDVESVESVYNMAQSAIDPKSILKLAFKAANRMTGSQDGARRGEWSNVSALPGQNKSGNLLDTFNAMCIFNDPVLFDKTKKPLHVYTTIEDKLELVFQKLYILLKQHEFDLPIKVEGLDPKEMADYVYKRLTARGWHIRFVELPVGSSTDEYIDILKSLQDDGFEIVSAGCDYVNLLGSQGIAAQVAGDEVQGKHRKIRGFTSPNNIFHYTAHQLSTDAKLLARNFPDDYVRKLPGKGYYEGCKKLDTEFDYEYVVAKTVSGGATWQEFQWAKHRKLGATPDSDKYFALKFQELPMIGFKYDQDTDFDYSYKKVGAKTTKGEGVDLWDEFDEGS